MPLEAGKYKSTDRPSCLEMADSTADSLTVVQSNPFQASQPQVCGSSV